MIARIQAGDDPGDVAARGPPTKGRWRLLRTKYLLYRGASCAVRYRLQRS